MEVATRGVLKNAVLKHFAIFTGRHLSWSLFLIKLQTSDCFCHRKRSSSQNFNPFDAGGLLMFSGVIERDIGMKLVKELLWERVPISR